MTMAASARRLAEHNGTCGPAAHIQNDLLEHRLAHMLDPMKLDTEMKLTVIEFPAQERIDFDRRFAKIDRQVQKKLRRKLQAAACLGRRLVRELEVLVVRCGPDGLDEVDLATGVEIANRIEKLASAWRHDI